MSYDSGSARTISGKDAAGDQGGDRDDASDAVRTEAIVNEAAKRLLDAIERVERLTGERAAIGEDIKTIFAEIKGMGFEPKIVRKIIRLRAQDRDEWIEEQSILHTYMDALDMDYHGKGAA